MINFFEGSLEGNLVSPKSKRGFGWDSIFQPKGHNTTFAEMNDTEKNEISIKRIALNKLKAFID